MKRFFSFTFFLLSIFYAISPTLNAQDLAFAYICPVPGSMNLNPEQTITLKCIEPINPISLHAGVISILGTKSGHVPVKFLLSKDYKTIIFIPERSFVIGETISVSINDGISTLSRKQIAGLSFEFSIISHDRQSLNARLEQLLEEKEDFFPAPPDNKMLNINNTLPDDFPAPTVYSYGEHDNNYIFVNLNCRNPSLPWNLFIAIFDSYGTPVFFEESSLNRINFSPLPDGTSCYATNMVINNEQEKYYILDSASVVIDSVNTGNGYILDAHELLLLSNGHYLVMSYDPQPVNMSQIVPGGNPNAIVTGLVIQEVDNNQNVYFQWRSWDHFQITDATDDINLTAPAIDYVHGNAFEIDHDGNILLSSRHLDEITKINFNNGEVIWRFGKNSENNMFTINDDPVGFTHQHDIELIYNGHYTIFDNGNLRSPPYSRVLEYALNENTMTADLVWEYQHSPNIYAGSAGSFRTQSNGERIIGWGGTFPEAITELQSDNSLLREFYFPAYVTSYRAVKGTWETNVFTSQESLSMGNFSGQSGMKVNYLYIYNRTNKVVRISSAHHHSDEFVIMDDFPVSIFPYSFNFIRIGFLPGNEGEFTDRLTLNYDNADTSRRIARQLNLVGNYNMNTPTLVWEPSFGMNNVDPATSIVATFSEAVKKVFGGEITDDDIPNLFELKVLNRNGNSLPITGAINAEKTVVTINPAVGLDENQQYYLRLRGGMISDYDGFQMKLDEESYFSTGLYTAIRNVVPGHPKIFPNPVRNKLRIAAMNDGNKAIRVYTSSGKLILSTNHAKTDAIIDMTNQEAGLYLITILYKESGESVTYKFIKNAAFH